MWTLPPPAAHAHWLYELRSVVTTASVAASLGRGLMGQDAASAMEALKEAEHALERCRALLDAGAGHLRDDDAAAGTAPVWSSSERRREDDPALDARPRE